MSGGKGEIEEEIVVIFHAALLGRTDVLKNAISSIKASGKYAEDDIPRLLSTSRELDGATPLHVATHYGHTDVIRALLNAGVDVAMRPTIGDFAGKRPYDIAHESAKATFHVFFFEQIAMGHVAVAERLLDGGVPLTLADESPAADTALHWAASFGHVAIAEMLLKHGFPVDLVNQEGKSALHVAVQAKSLAVTRLLLAEGASAAILDDGHRSVLDVATTLAASGAADAVAVVELLRHPPEVTRACHESHVARLEAQRRQLEQLSGLSAASMDIADADTAAVKSRPVPGPVESPAPDGDSAAGDEDDEFAAPYTSTVLFDDDDDDGRGDGGAAEEDEEEEGVFLVFWPPVFRQKRPRRPTGGLTLFLDENLVVGVVDAAAAAAPAAAAVEAITTLFALVSDSGLLAALDEVGFQVQVKRHAATHPSAQTLAALDGDDATATAAAPVAPRPHVLLQIDAHRCPLPQSYQLRVSATQVSLVGGDVAGLLYACYALVQLVQLHAQRPSHGHGHHAPPPATSPRSFFSRDAAAGGAARRAGLVLPRIAVEDRPTTAATRAVSWSLRAQSQVLTDTTRLQHLLRLCSRVHVNRVYLQLDADRDDGRDGSGCDGGGRLPLRDIAVLDRLCRRLQLELVPTVVLASPRETIPRDALAYFSQPLIHLVVLVDPATAVAAGSDADGLRQWFRRELVRCQQAAFRSVQCTVSPAFRRLFSAAGVAPETWAPSGVSRWDTSLAAWAPASLQDRPLLAQEEFLARLATHVQTVEESGDALVHLSLFSERDFWYPALLLRFHLVVYGGLAWQRGTALDMIGDPRRPARGAAAAALPDAGAASDAAAHAAPSSTAATTPATTPTAAGVAAQLSSGEVATLKRGLSLWVTQVLLQSWRGLCRQTLAVPPGATAAAAAAAASTPSLGDVSRAEMFRAEPAAGDALRGGGAAADDDADAADGRHATGAAATWPSRSDASLVLKSYRRLLAAAQWRPTTIATAAAASPSPPSSSQAAASSSSAADAAAAAPLSFIEFFLGRATPPAPPAAPHEATAAPAATAAASAAPRDDPAAPLTTILDAPAALHAPLSSSASSASTAELEYRHFGGGVLGEVDEVFALLHLLSIVAKLLLQTEHALALRDGPAAATAAAAPVAMSYRRLREQVQSLSGSARSDVANVLLEALFTLTQRWHGRFRRDALFAALQRSCFACLPVLRKHLPPAAAAAAAATVPATATGPRSFAQWQQRHRRRFLIAPRAARDATDAAAATDDDDVDRYEAQLPAWALFALLCEGLALPKTVEDFVVRIFQ
eukprot:gene5465-3895_t